MTIRKLYTTVKFFSVACLVVMLGSCSDEFFDAEVGERNTAEDHYEDYIDAEKSFYGALISLQDVAANAILVDGLRSDQMVPNNNASNDLLEIANLNMRATNPFLDPSGYYRSIINVNEVLLQIDKAYQRDRDFLTGQVFDMRATLYGLRAYCYLSLVRSYGEVNYLEDNVEVIPEDLKGNVLKKDALLDTLINQFFTDSVIYDGTEGRKENVYTQFPSYKAVLGELYLEKGDFEKAIKYLKMGLEDWVPTNAIGLNDIIGYTSSDVYKVDRSYQEQSWENIFRSAENKIAENICVIPYNQTEGQTNPIVQYFLPSDQYMVLPARHLVDSMQAAIQLGRFPDTADVYRGIGVTYDTIPFTGYFYDVTLPNPQDPGRDTTITMYYPSEEYFISKYSIEVDDPYSTDVILQRAGELHLLLAEALNRAGRSEAAITLLNSGFSADGLADGFNSNWNNNQGIRGRVSLASRIIPHDTILIAEGIDKIELVEDYLLQEKAMECAFEGKRMSDLIRVALRRDNPEDFLSTIIARKYSDDPVMQAKVKEYYMNQENWYLPNK